MRPQQAWKVRIHSPRPLSPSSRCNRSLISPAALFVKVMARISFAFAPTALIRWATRYVRTRVFPEPAPAITSSGPSVARTASRWGGLRSARYCSGDATAMRPMLAARQAVHFEPPEAERLVSGARESVDATAPSVLPASDDDAVTLEPPQCRVDRAARHLHATSRERPADRVTVRRSTAQLLENEPVDHRPRIRRLPRPCSSR